MTLNLIIKPVSRPQEPAVEYQVRSYILSLIAERKTTAKQIAKDAKVSQATLSRWLDPRRDKYVLSWPVFNSICNAVNLQVEVTRLVPPC